MLYLFHQYWGYKTYNKIYSCKCYFLQELYSNITFTHQKDSTIKDIPLINCIQTFITISYNDV